MNQGPYYEKKDSVNYIIYFNIGFDEAKYIILKQKNGWTNHKIKCIKVSGLLLLIYVANIKLAGRWKIYYWRVFVTILPKFYTYGEY